MYKGITGALKIGVTYKRKKVTIPVAYISNWNVEDSAEIIEVTKAGSAHKEAYAGYQRWSASADGAAWFLNEGQEELYKAKKNGDKITLELYFEKLRKGIEYALDRADRKNTLPKPSYFSGECFIESYSVDFTAEGIAKISISVKGSGPLNLIKDTTIA